MFRTSAIMITIEEREIVNSQNNLKSWYPSVLFHELKRTKQKQNVEITKRFVILSGIVQHNKSAKGDMESKDVSGRINVSKE